jgi:hypothetical protein
MTAAGLERWYQFKGMEQGNKKHCEAIASSAGQCGNISTYVKPRCEGAPWLIDSGASRHMAGSSKDFMKYVPDSKGQSVKLADGSTRCIMG